ncbi:hypothetical protein ASPZODRAFT_774269 [Penicilliopsis zonata CBS 506.65]|uniref:XPG-I domain-containing protein n=1 Tax=Penicilliopsis zonata CBS 506.65 TaxID=1073090 RepID=A0A1L9SAY4_9EURO|nr:hypothetical protein ASPZODRAFT_774269 [Penicilliopsis zonata CBS 506.65]OJJ44333.1 hypothetical protein ASPZODRAFT_774269 [Penicilliopsis zonata CBS 506.65]
MGIPGLINAIGSGERISLSKLAISHLRNNKRPIRIAVDISIWLFQVQAGRGGRNPELRTLFYRLLKFLALPIHPLFVYDGRQKPPFKRGKAVGGRSYGSAPIISLSKILIRLFKFPIHDAPGEAEAECARLQRAGVVDAVMSNDVDALMFGSSWTVMNFSKEPGSGTTAATHLDCYRIGGLGGPPNVPFDRAGMILFAMLSGGDYLPTGVPKCGSKLAGEIAKAGFGADLLEALESEELKLESNLADWRERLQYELDENESGYFQTKHKAVRIPEAFPDRTILSYYANPVVSTEEEAKALELRLQSAWDQEIDALEIRRFTAEYFEWNYRSGARKIIKLLADPLVSYRLRLQRPVLAFGAPLLSELDTPILQKIYRSRTSFSTDGQTELQVDMIPIDVVGIDLMSEEANPQTPLPESVESADEEDEQDQTTGPVTPSISKIRVTRRYDPCAPEKVWVFETIAAMGIPEVVEKWKREQAEKAGKAGKSATAKKAPARKSAPRKKGPIDSGMKSGSILKYGTLSKQKPEMSPAKQAQLLQAAASPASRNSYSSKKDNLKSPNSPFGSMMVQNLVSKEGFSDFRNQGLDDFVERFFEEFILAALTMVRWRQ